MISFWALMKLRLHEVQFPETTPETLIGAIVFLKGDESRMSQPLIANFLAETAHQEFGRVLMNAI